jgi:glycosyltransferase A (GT-A) superfamily protein (DUF2064 family)
MLKAPHRSKRRLATRIGRPAATVAAHHLAACALEDVSAWSGDVCYAPAERRDLKWLTARVGTAASVVLQRGANLGERLNHVDAVLRERGVSREIFIGTDCPEIDAEYLREAAAALRKHDAVLGPAADGGVVLMGARRPWPDLAALPWSTPRLHSALARLCRVHGWSLATLGQRRDIDTPGDLASIGTSLAADARPARRALTRWLRNQPPELGQTAQESKC